MIDRLALPTQARRAVQHHAVPDRADEGIAQIGLAAQAVEAVAAAGRPVQHDVIAGLDVSHAITHGLDDARAFVPGHDRQWMFRRAADEVIIAVAHAAGFDLHQHLAGARRIEIERFDLNGLLRRSDERALEFSWLPHLTIEIDRPSRFSRMIGRMIDSRRGLAANASL